MNPVDFDYVRGVVRESAAIVLEPGKEYLVESRLSSLARKEGFASLDHLIEKLRNGPRNGLHRKVVDAMTTNETSFFRDIHPFEALRQSILPELMARRAAEKRLSFWCGAAATGQEVYSVLMLIKEHFPELLRWDFKFIATDLCTEVLARARSGIFNQLEVNRGLPARYLVKYFTPRGLDWEICSDLRNLVEFRELNLAQEWVGLPQVDMVFLRNVLIYFDADTKKAILRRIRSLLRPGGLLLLGSAETTFNLDDNFERGVYGKTTCYRLKAA